MQGENINSHYKDTVFRMLFSDKKRLLSLYNALSSKKCDDPDEMTVVTLKNAIYMEVKNDTAFLVGTELYLVEHQSTPNPNMPLRFLEYIAAEYQRFTGKRSTYTRKLLKLPRPHFVVFYNGTDETPEHEMLRLSEAFEGEGDASLELVTDVYNINAGHNVAMQDACDTLKGYAEFVKRTRDNQKTLPFDEAVNKAVDDCIKDGILADFFRANKSEVVGMSIFEFDREEHDRQVQDEYIAEGVLKGAKEKALKTARNMLRMGFQVTQIAEATELSVEEIVTL